MISNLINKKISNIDLIKLFKIKKNKLELLIIKK